MAAGFYTRQLRLLFRQVELQSLVDGVDISGLFDGGQPGGVFQGGLRVGYLLVGLNDHAVIRAELREKQGAAVLQFGQHGMETLHGVLIGHAAALCDDTRLERGESGGGYRQSFGYLR